MQIGIGSRQAPHGIPHTDAFFLADRAGLLYEIATPGRFGRTFAMLNGLCAYMDILFVGSRIRLFLLAGFLELVDFLIALF